MVVRAAVLLSFLMAGCGQSSDNSTPDGSQTPDAVSACTDTPTNCATKAEQTTSDTFDGLIGTPDKLAAFLKLMPKGGDLHNHLSGAVYAETVLGWASDDQDCINTSTHTAVTTCGSGTQPVPTAGSFYDAIVQAWSMEGFLVGGPESGHDHFFATFGKFGSVAGIHRDDSLVDLVQRAADENQVYIETMFNLGKNVGALGASLWSGTLTTANLDSYYTMLTTNSGFAAQLAADVAVVNSAGSYKSSLGCAGTNPPKACSVGMRFVAQISRTGANDVIFGQLISAFEMAKQTNQIVAANLSSPEDNSASLTNYKLHMAMLDYLHTKYAGTSPLHVTLHAGELTAQYLPANSTDNTFHIRDAVEVGHAERIGHGLDIASETDSAGLLDEMHARNVLVEICLSSNDQILEVSGAAHPLAQYLAHGVPVALATDDQGVSRSSLAGEYLKAALDQHLTYRQLKMLARQSLEHAFLPGASLWTSVSPAQPVTDCAATDAMAVGGSPSATCAAFLAGSERATAQWELERRFLAFESQSH